MKRKKTRRQSLSYGTLEPKRLLAGNVSANFDGEHIFIRGDQQDNQIQIFADNGRIRIAGSNGTTINNRPSVIVGNSTPVGGSNRATTEFSGGLRIHTGPGNDRLDIDNIRLNDVSIIYGGTGDDFVDISNTEFFSSALVQTFTGDDDVTITNTRVTDTLVAITHEGDDNLALSNSETLGSVIAATGDGDDFLLLEANQHLGAPQYFLTNDGNDTVEIQNPNIGTAGLQLYTGNGDDEVIGQVVTGDIAGSFVIAGQGDTDTTRLEIAPNVSSQLSVRGFEFTGEVVFQNADEVDFGFATFRKPDDSFFVADFVEFDRATRLSGIDWLGSYENSNAPVTGDRFVIEIYEGGLVTNDAIGTYEAPVGQPIATFDIGDNANRTNTGLTWSNFGPERSIFSYSADIDFTMNANTQYWISIFSVPTADQGADFNNDYYTLLEDIEFELDGSNNGAANVKWPNFPDWFPNTSGKTHFTLRS